MATKFLCDRCDIEINEADRIKAASSFSRGTVMLHSATLDLCAPCTEVARAVLDAFNVKVPTSGDPVVMP